MSSEVRCDRSAHLDLRLRLLRVGGRVRAASPRGGRKKPTTRGAWRRRGRPDTPASHALPQDTHSTHGAAVRPRVQPYNYSSGGARTAARPAVVARRAKVGAVARAHAVRLAAALEAAAAEARAARAVHAARGARRQIAACAGLATLALACAAREVARAVTARARAAPPLAGVACPPARQSHTPPARGSGLAQWACTVAARRARARP